MIYRKALLTDAEKIYEKGNYYAEKGQMLAHSRHWIYENTRIFRFLKLKERG